MPEKVGYAVVDVETTGFSPVDCGIVEVGVVLLDPDRNVTGSFETLIKPMVPLEATHIHQIYPNMLRNAPSFNMIAKQLATMFDGRKLIAHNARFDASFLGQELSMAGVSGLSKINFVDTLSLCQDFLNLPNNKLGTVAEFFNIVNSHPHGALNDAFVTAEIFKELAQLSEVRHETYRSSKCFKLSVPAESYVPTMWIGRNGASSSVPPIIDNSNNASKLKFDRPRSLRYKESEQPVWRHDIADESITPLDSNFSLPTVTSLPVDSIQPDSSANILNPSSVRSSHEDLFTVLPFAETQNVNSLGTRESVVSVTPANVSPSPPAAIPNRVLGSVLALSLIVAAGFGVTADGLWKLLAAPAGFVGTFILGFIVWGIISLFKPTVRVSNLAITLILCLVATGSLPAAFTSEVNSPIFTFISNFLLGLGSSVFLWVICAGIKSLFLRISRRSS